jgi:hypothetical protein
MPASTSAWGRSINRLFGTARENAPRRKAGGRARARQHGFERLEDRTVLSATFGSALSIGNDMGSSKAFDVSTDQAGNSYVTGMFSNTVDFDQAAAHVGDIDILTARGPHDAFVAKYAPDNSLLWVRRMGGDALDSGTGISDTGTEVKIDGSENVYVAGYFIGPADFGSNTLTTAGDRNGFLAKLDAGGNFQWAKSWGTSAEDRASGLGVDSAGNAYALGYYQVGAYWNFDIVKFSSSGNAVWSKSIAAQTYSGPSSDLAVSSAGNVFVAGSFRGIVDFDPSSKTNYVYGGPSVSGNGFVLKLNTDGKFGWVSPFVGQSNGYSAAQSLALDSSGNVIVGGYYGGSVDFKPGFGTTTLPIIGGGFITKLNSSGGLVWARALESTSSTLVKGLAVDSAGRIYATGSFYGTVDFNPGAGTYNRTTIGGSDIFVVQFTSDGNLSWAETFGSAEYDVGSGVAVDSTGVVHLAGWYLGTIDFDPDPLATYLLTNPGTFNNAFRVRLGQA